MINESAICRLATLAVIKWHIEEYSKYYVPVAASNRHIHLGQRELDALFGKGYTLNNIRDLVQPGQYVCNERVGLIGPKGRIDGIRVLGPVRKQTQVELSVTDAYKAGIPVAVRMSGDLAGTPGCKLVGPAGEIEISSGVIISARHLHISDEQAGWYGIKNGDIVRIVKGGERATVFENVIVRAGNDHSLEMHIDTDEANAAGICGPEILEMAMQGSSQAKATGPVYTKEAAIEELDLVTEWEIKLAKKEGRTSIPVKKGGIITPLAKETANDLKIQFIMSN